MENTKEDALMLETLRAVAGRMMVAARTAPKGKGIDNLVMKLVEGEELKKISENLHALGTRIDHAGFIRDAKNILSASLMLLLGTRIRPMGLKKCGMCGFSGCEEKSKHTSVPCVFNAGDLGIALGSAVSVAMDNRVDNRIMYTVGQTVLEMGIMGEDVKVVFAVPLSATSKNPFFDRG